MDCPNTDLLPDLNQGIGELVDCPVWVWKPSNALIHDVQGVLDRGSGPESMLARNCVNAIIF